MKVNKAIGDVLIALFLKKILTFVARNDIIVMGYKIGGGNMPDKKLGRPTDNPKSKPIHVRLDADCDNILERYCEQESIPKTEGIRRGIKLLKAELKK